MLENYLIPASDGLKYLSASDGDLKQMSDCPGCQAMLGYRLPDQIDGYLIDKDLIYSLLLNLSLILLYLIALDGPVQAPPVQEYPALEKPVLDFPMQVI